MQALSLAVHIPLVCFGIAFPAMFLFVEGLYLRTGNSSWPLAPAGWPRARDRRPENGRETAGPR